VPQSYATAARCQPPPGRQPAAAAAAAAAAAEQLTRAWALSTSLKADQVSVKNSFYESARSSWPVCLGDTVGPQGLSPAQ
jgi:hypothetical protein